MKLAIPVLSFGAWASIMIMAILNPSGTLPMLKISKISAILMIISVLPVTIGPFHVFSSRTFREMLTRWVVGFLLLLVFSLYGSIAWHRDFSVFPAQLIMIYLIILLLTIDRFQVVRRKHLVYRYIYAGALLVFGLWTMWLMLMSWAIVSRQEPRWIETTAYNIVNGLIGICLLVAAALLRERSMRMIQVNGTTITLDGRSIDDHLSPQEGQIIRAFLQEPTHTHSCSTLSRLLRTDTSLDHGQPTTPVLDCLECLDERWTASDCPAYRNLKNRITGIKKYLELLQIGTLVPVSENSRDIKELGWCLRFFDDVRYESTVD